MGENTADDRRFGEFYRRLHFVGTTLGLAAALHAFSTLNFSWLAWVGHFFSEKNRPATFAYPLYSFAGDWVMWKEMLTGRIRF